MDADLKALEQKLTQLIELCHELRRENSALREQIHTIESDSALLKSNMAKASDRIAALLSNLP